MQCCPSALIFALTIIFFANAQIQSVFFRPTRILSYSAFLGSFLFFRLMWWMFGTIITGSTCIFNGCSLIALQGPFQCNLYILFNQMKSRKLCGASAKFIFYYTIKMWGKLDGRQQWWPNVQFRSDTLIQLLLLWLRWPFPKESQFLSIIFYVSSIFRRII